MKKILLLITLFASFAIASYSQSPTRIAGRCPSPNANTYGSVNIPSTGTVVFTPCPTKSSIFAPGSTVDFTGTTVIGTAFASLSLPNGTAAAPALKFTNSTTTGFYRSANNVLGIATNGVENSLFSAAVNSQRSASYTWQNVAANAEFALGFTPSVAAGSALIGDCTVTPTTCLKLDQTANISTLSSGPGGNINIDSQTGSTVIGDIGGLGNSTIIGISDSSQTVDVEAPAELTLISPKIGLLRTITAIGTTGAQTINKPAGTLNVAAGQSSIVLTNSTIDADSLPFLTLRVADTTCTFIKSAVNNGGAHTLTITLNAACNATQSIGFLITN